MAEFEWGNRVSSLVEFWGGWSLALYPQAKSLESFCAATDGISMSGDKITAKDGKPSIQLILFMLLNEDPKAKIPNRLLGDMLKYIANHRQDFNSIDLETKQRFNQFLQEQFPTSKLTNQQLSDQHNNMVELFNAGQLAACFDTKYTEKPLFKGELAEGENVLENCQQLSALLSDNEQLYLSTYNVCNKVVKEINFMEAQRAFIESCLGDIHKSFPLPN